MSAFQKFYNKYTVIPQSQIVYYNNLENTIGVNAIIIQTDAIRPTYIVSFTGLNTSSLYDIGSILLFDGSLVNTASIMSPIPINSYSNYTPKITKGLYILLNHFLQTYSIFNTLIQYVENYAQQGKYVQVYFSGHSQGALLSFIMNELFIQYGEGILTRDHIPPAMIHASFVGFACPSLLTKSFLDYMNDIPTQLSKAHLPIQEDSESIYSFKTDLVPYMAGGYIDPLFSYNPETITGYPFSVIGLGLHLLATHTLGLIASRSTRILSFIG